MPTIVRRHRLLPTPDGFAESEAQAIGLHDLDRLSETQAMRLPSGDHTGLTSATLFSVSLRRAVPLIREDSISQSRRLPRALVSYLNVA